MSVLASGKAKVGTLVAESIYDNPVVTRELRTRMRGLKAFMVMGGYVLLVGGLLFIGYLVTWNEYSGSNNWGMSLANRNVGMKLFQWLMWTQAILLSLVIPSLTFSSITQELERRSMEMLALTRLSAGKIVLGKQLSGFLYSLVLLVCSLPLASMCLMFGGISPGEIAGMYAALTAWAFLLTCMGVFWSSLFNRTASAALFAYGVMGVYFLLTLPMGFASFGNNTAHPLGALNPGLAIYTSMQKSAVCGVNVSPALVAVLLHLALGALLLLVASTHVRFHKVNRALPIKLLTIAITLALVWLILGGLTPNTGAPSTPNGMRSAVSVSSAVIAGFLCLMAPIFATGELRKAPEMSMPEYALSVRRAFSRDLRGAIWFMVFWAAVLSAGLMGTVWWLAKSQSITLDHSVWNVGKHFAVYVVAMAAGLGAVGVLASSLVKARRNAAALVLIFVILAWAGYSIVMAYYVPGLTNTTGPVWQLAAFWPLTPTMAQDGWYNMPKLWWSPQDAWRVCSAAYLAIAAMALLTASRPARKGGGVREE